MYKQNILFCWILVKMRMEIYSSKEYNIPHNKVTIVISGKFSKGRKVFALLEVAMRKVRFLRIGLLLLSSLILIGAWLMVWMLAALQGVWNGREKNRHCIEESRNDDGECTFLHISGHLCLFGTIHHFFQERCGRSGRNFRDANAGNCYRLYG